MTRKKTGIRPSIADGGVPFPGAPPRQKTGLDQPASAAGVARPRAEGKFIFIGTEKYFIRGVTYGTFRPSREGVPFPEPSVVDADFRSMAAQGINSVRTYTVPPRWLLDAAQKHGLRIMADLSWANHMVFLDKGRTVKAIRRQVGQQARSISGHPALLCFSIGNEIPAPVVRYHGKKRIESFLKTLYDTVKSADAKSLVTYVNYPSTEYLDPDFIDIACFNVYLESRPAFQSYLARLQSLAAGRPLVLSELGLDSRRNGLGKQAESLGWQVRDSFAAGSAGTFVFQWTDEWHRGGCEINDWDFGLVARGRKPKPALASVRKAYAEVPFARDAAWPRVSVVLCTYNGSRFIRDAMEGLSRLDYPNHEVIVVNDGSTDSTLDIVSEYGGMRVITTENNGLSMARNIGLSAASGEIVAYIDDDAYPDRHWLKYLASAFDDPSVAGAGGPNLLPPGTSLVERCVDGSPGNPIPVLVDDREAEHITGCNMAFRKGALEAIGGFDTQFRVAGDDVDLCWRIREKGWRIGYHAAAQVWHHRRNQVRTYLKQQKGYGRAEAMLERKWPEKYNSAGHITWAGRIYGNGLPRSIAAKKERVYHGVWGLAPFQSLYEPRASAFSHLLLMPEWYLVVASAGLLSLVGAGWHPLLAAALPLFIISLLLVLAQALEGALRGKLDGLPPSARVRARLLTWFLHLAQPAARLSGRINSGLGPWREKGAFGMAALFRREYSLWSEAWRSPESWLRMVEEAVRSGNTAAMRGSEFDRWDLQVLPSLLCRGRLVMAVEEHGGGRQMLRFRVWSRVSLPGVGAFVLLLLLSLGALHDHAWTAGGALGAAALLLVAKMFTGTARALTCFARALGKIEQAIMKNNENR
jgi:O-antigen biosynthesis protein